MAFMAKDKIVRTGDDLNLATLVALQSDATVLGNVADAAAGQAFSRIEKIAVVELADANTGGGVLSWENEEDTAIIITRLIVDVTTESTAACTVDFGTTAVNATTSSDNLLDGVDVAAVAMFDNLDANDVGTSGKTKQKLAAGDWVTGSMAGGDATDLVGKAYIHYVLA